ncbi:MAG TPA: thiamine pyrophosphate-binding protein [Terriglobales bacterium]
MPTPVELDRKSIEEIPNAHLEGQTWSIGSYLASRLEEIGVKHHFAVAGDYNLALLDQLLLNKNIQQVYCCNELNCSFSAEGYARANGVAACVVTFSVGSITAFDGLAGAYAEELPVILISGAPNSNDFGDNHLVHHALGTLDLQYPLDFARRITCEAVAITHPEEAPHLIDKAIRAALRKKKPVYIEIPCNLASAQCSKPKPVDWFETPKSDPASLKAAVREAAQFLENAVRPVMLAGPKLRSHGGIEAFRRLAEAVGCGVAVMPSAKSFFPEQHRQYIGIYLGAAGSPGSADVVDSSDAVFAAGPLFTDYTTTGWTAQPSENRLIQVDPHRVRVGATTFNDVYLAEFLSALAKVVKPKPKTLVEFDRTKVQVASPPAADPGAPLTRAEMCRQIQGVIDRNTTLIVETGDSWFNGLNMNLPDAAKFEIEMQWGHIGWSVPATFGYAVKGGDRRIVLMVGDGSFQLTAQEVCQMIRLNLPVLIFLVNNRGYTIEVEIHDGPYNNVKNWDYSGLMKVFNAEDGHGVGLRATNGGELAAAIEKARAHTGGPVMIECTIDRDDCTRQLLEWGSRVAIANARPQQRA